MFNPLRRRIGFVSVVAALGMLATTGSAFAATYTAFGHMYKTTTINGVEVPVADDGTILWNSIPDVDPAGEADVPVDAPIDAPDLTADLTS
jgi:hypothetical protein